MCISGKLEEPVHCILISTNYYCISTILHEISEVVIFVTRFIHESFIICWITIRLFPLECVKLPFAFPTKP
jgi:hypothetical protein